MLDDALVEVVRARGLRGRLRSLVAPGLTAAQAHARLPEDLGARHTVAEVYARLRALSETGQVRTRLVRWHMTLNTKGMRDMVVDVFWA